MRAIPLFVAAALTFAALPALAKPVVGQPAPDFSVADSSGRTQTLSAYKGKTVVLEWNNPECPFVRKHYGSGNMQKLQAAASAQGVIWLTVNSGASGKQGYLDAKAATAYVAKVGGKESAYLLDADGTVGHLYDAKTTPQMAVVDMQGVLRYLGGIDSIASTDADDIGKATPYVSQALAELAAGKTVSVPTSEPYGCSVKYGS
ncbi:MAG TPA: redoxin domain-containing protein [Dokdonella sp.]